MSQDGKEAQAELERAEAEQTGGQEHASRADREGAGAGRRAEGEREGGSS